MNTLQGKVAIITGSASGIGKAQALLFSKNGAKVVLADRDKDGIDKLEQEIKKNGGDVFAVQVDVSNDRDISHLVDETISKYGEVSILCNTAGMFDHYKPLLETDEAAWSRILEINLTSLYRVTSKVLPHMIEKGYGNVINISSGAGLIGGGGGMGYTSTKHAVVGFTKQLNAEYGHQGIRSNAIAPGLIETPMVQDLIDNPESGIMETLKKIPAGRYGQAEEVAELSLFLASEASKYIYGAVIPIDGGLLSTLR